MFLFRWSTQTHCVSHLNSPHIFASFPHLLINISFVQVNAYNNRTYNISGIISILFIFYIETTQYNNTCFCLRVRMLRSDSNVYDVFLVVVFSTSNIFIWRVFPSFFLSLSLDIYSILHLSVFFRSHVTSFCGAKNGSTVRTKRMYSWLGRGRR